MRRQLRQATPALPLIHERQGRTHSLIEQLPETEVPAAVRYLEFPIAREEPPVDPEMLARIDAARANPAEGIPHGDILREYGM